MTSRSNQPVVLIADGSLVVREVLRWHLEADGFEIVETADGEAVVDIASSVRPAVILLGVELDGVDGHVALTRLKARHEVRDTPVVFVTGHTDTDDLVEGLRLGAHDYLYKPFEPAEVVARVRAATRLKQLQDELVERNAELDRISRSDALTGLANRRHLDEQLASQDSAATRHGYNFSIALIDVDHFKAVNDTYGHADGDDVLCEVARRLKATARAEDIVGRWGGEEFMVVLPYCDVDHSYTIGERLREAVAVSPISTRSGAQLTVTISVGCATGPSPHLVERADLALYEAKETGRNRTVALPTLAPA